MFVFFGNEKRIEFSLLPFFPFSVAIGLCGKSVVFRFLLLHENESFIRVVKQAIWLLLGVLKKVRSKICFRFSRESAE